MRSETVRSEPRDDNERLNEVMSAADTDYSRRPTEVRSNNSAPQQPTTVASQDSDLCQWQVGPQGMFRPAAKTVKKLVPGAYTCDCDDRGPFLRCHSLMSDDIVELPESANARVLAGIRKFWTSRDKYESHGLIFKRGVLLWGPPGSGKTITIGLLVRDLIANGGIVIFCANPLLTTHLLSSVRRIEPSRPLIVVLEDIDETIGRHGEHEILSMLDGENHTSNVVYVATTNYPDRLGARIVNRPSRFDDRIFVGMPSEVARRAYLDKATGGSECAAKWAAETSGLSISHLRELVAAVMCLDQGYEDVLARLRSMCERPKEVDGYAKRSVGFEQVGR